MSNRRGLSIRTASAADAPALCDLLCAAGNPIAPAVLASRLATIAAGSGTALAAWEWGPPSGVIVLHWYDTLHSPRRAQIDLLLIGPEHRRRGIGRMLIKAASQAARAAGCGVLEVNAAPGDGETEAFCVATGFAPRGVMFIRTLRRGA